MRIRSLNCKFFFIAIYGLHIIEGRRSLWGKLRNINSGHQQYSWLSTGDYNSIHKAEERMIEFVVLEGEPKDFDSFLVDTGIAVVRHNRREFTWTNEHSYSRIDWDLVNAK